MSRTGGYFQLSWVGKEQGTGHDRRGIGGVAAGTACGPLVVKYAQDDWEPGLREAVEGQLTDRIGLTTSTRHAGRLGWEPAPQGVREFKSGCANSRPPHWESAPRGDLEGTARGQPAFKDALREVRSPNPVWKLRPSLILGRQVGPTGSRRRERGGAKYGPRPSRPLGGSRIRAGGGGGAAGVLWAGLHFGGRWAGRSLAAGRTAD